MRTQKLLKVIIGIFFCLVANAILIGIYFGFLGLESSQEVQQYPFKYYLGHILYVFFINFTYGIGFYLLGVFIFHTLANLLNKIFLQFKGYPILLGFVWGATYASLLIALLIIRPINIKGMPIFEILMYGVVGTIYGWLYYSWIDRENLSM